MHTQHTGRHKAQRHFAVSALATFALMFDVVVVVTVVRSTFRRSIVPGSPNYFVQTHRLPQATISLLRSYMYQGSNHTRCIRQFKRAFNASMCSSTPLTLSAFSFACCLADIFFFAFFLVFIAGTGGMEEGTLPNSVICFFFCFFLGG